MVPHVATTRAQAAVSMAAHIRHTLGKAPARPQLAGRVPVKLLFSIALQYNHWRSTW